MRLLDKIKSSSETLERSGVPDALVDSELLVLHAAGLDRLRAYIDNPEVDRNLLSRINRLVKRRAAGEPLQYIIGHIEFLGLKVRVGKGVLIPRPETELLVEEAIKAAFSQQSVVSNQNNSALLLERRLSQSFLDLCTGSGCIALALAKAFPTARVYGTDISLKAIKYARENTEINKIRNVSFVKGSLFTPLKKQILFDIITANPPYIKSSDIDGLQREVKDWEPLGALDGGPDGLNFYRQIFSQASKYIKKNGCVLVELGFDQSEAVQKIAIKRGFHKITPTKDFAGIERVLKAEK